MIRLLSRLAPVLGLLTALSMMLIGAGGVQAQAPVRTVGSGVETIEIEVNKGALVRLPEPASAVFVANPAYADISMKSPTLVYVMAKQTGETSLFALDGRDAVLANINLMVTHNVSALSASLRSVLPDTAIEARSVPGGLMLAGFQLPNKFFEADGTATDMLAQDWKEFWGEATANAL